MLPAGAGPRSTIRRGAQRLVRWKDPWLPVGRRNRLGLARELRALEIHETGDRMSPGARGQKVLDARRGERANRGAANAELSSAASPPPLQRLVGHSSFGL